MPKAFVLTLWILPLATLLASQGVAQVKPQRIRVSQEVAEKLVVERAPLPYPPDARAARVQGSVVLQATIGKDGAVKDLRLVSGHPLLVQAAMSSVKQWKYKPFLLNGEPVEVETQVSVPFTLEDSQASNQNPSDQTKTEGAVGERNKMLVHMKIDNTPPAAPIAEPDGKKRVRVSQGVTDGLVVHRVAASYPEAARASGIHGDVILKVIIGTDGTVQNVQAISGDSALVPAAIDAVKQWKYKPYFLNGSPMEVETTTVVDFKVGN